MDVHGRSMGINWNRIDLTLSSVMDNLSAYLDYLVDYVSLIRRAFFKKLQYKKQKYCSPSWQEAPEDVIQMILEHMNLSGRVRFGSLCKFWRFVSLQRDIRTPPQLPWLVHPHTCEFYLSFSSLSEGKVFNLRLPRTGWFRGSSNGWLFMLKRYWWLNSKQLLLLNPISGAQHQLPYLVNCSDIYEGVALSSSDISKCMVAVVFNDKELGLCRPGDKSWSVFQVLDENNNLGTISRLLFSSSGMLYALVYDGGFNGVGAVQTLKLGDDEVKLQLVGIELEWWIDNGLDIFPGGACRSYLFESTNNEVLLIHQIYDRVDEEDHANEDDNMEGNNNNEQGDVVLIEELGNEDMGGEGDNEDDKRAGTFEYIKTRCFRIYKIDVDNGNFRRVQTLGEQVLFVAEYSASMALPASDFKELQGNCIYFATNAGHNPHLESYISREIGIFYMDSGRIERPFPGIEIPRHSRLSWFTPSLW